MASFGTALGKESGIEAEAATDERAIADTTVTASAM